ncbi:hypothetical protein [Neisseria sp. P0003.S003]|uniref:hypothetical protein n=1 Tax=unclassified Neisseria TaxID=2623750 RepID=UPI003F81CD4F
MTPILTLKITIGLIWTLMILNVALYLYLVLVKKHNAREELNTLSPLRDCLVFFGFAWFLLVTHALLFMKITIQ